MDLERSVAITPTDPWLPGDVILDAAGHLWIRSDSVRFPWGYPDEGTRGYVPDGGVPDDEVPRPLTLLVRDGRPILTLVQE